MTLAKAGFVLGVKPLSVLRPHEQTIPDHVRRLSSDVKRDGIQKDPIIIDQDSLTVLDGMHRLAAFAALGVENAVCCSVDYSSKAVTVGRWARVYTLAQGESMEQILKRSNINRRVALAKAFNALDTGESGLAAFSSDAAYLPDGKLELEGAMSAIEELDSLSASRWQRNFVPEDDMDVPLQSERNLVVMVRRLGKDDVVKAGRSGRLFPCKTSMHLIDPRPVAVNFPLDKLDRATAAGLRELLSGREERMLPSNSMYEGRRYKERLLLLNQG